jgi:hypothetical protein
MLASVRLSSLQQVYGHASALTLQQSSAAQLCQMPANALGLVVHPRGASRSAHVQLLMSGDMLRLKIVSCVVQTRGAMLMPPHHRRDNSNSCDAQHPTALH